MLWIFEAQLVGISLIDKLLPDINYLGLFIQNFQKKNNLFFFDKYV